MEWLREQVAAIPVRLVFESSLELMGSTQVGSFKVGVHIEVALPEFAA